MIPPPVPPDSLRMAMGPFEDPAVFLTSGRDTLDLAVRLTGLEPTHRLLDLGCGCGRVALAAMQFLGERGSYAGLDVDAGCIDWCVKNIEARDGRFAFTCLDVRSDAYNPLGALSADQAILPYADGSFDRALVSSVFTHLPEGGIAQYLAELQRVVVSDGFVLVSLLLMNDATRSAVRAGTTSFVFVDRFGAHSWVLEASRPLEGVAVEEGWFQNLARRQGFLIQELTYGTWRTTHGWKVQHDWLVLHRLSKEAA
jgi:ubiquinone/menaquinone biosynthesis C-methylase UbiE